MPDYLRDVTKRLDRAKANFERFETELKTYLGSATGPYRAGVKLQNQATGECVIVAEVEPHPDWALVISDVVTDYRFALDHLAYQLVIRNTGQDPPPDPDGIEFPDLSRSSGVR